MTSEMTEKDVALLSGLVGAKIRELENSLYNYSDSTIFRIQASNAKMMLDQLFDIKERLFK